MAAATAKLVTLEQWAAAHRVRIGYMIRLRSEPGFPRPILRHGRESFYDAKDIGNFFRETRAHYKLTRGLAQC